MTTDGGSLGDRLPPDASPGDERVAAPEVAPGQPCAVCGDAEAVHRLRLVADWVDYLTEHHGLVRGDGPPLAPLCEWCHSWAEVLELAELARENLGRAERIRLAQHRNRLLDALDAEHVAAVERP